MPPRSRLLGIGIDLISWNRVERFLAQHSFEFLKRLLKPSEQSAFRKSPSPVQFFARSFTAKEAFFKACGGGSWGEAGWGEIEILMDGQTRFRVAGEGAEGRFFETPNGMGAEVLAWGKRTR